MKIMVLSVTRDHRRLDIAQRARNQPKPVKQVNDRPSGCLRAGVRDQSPQVGNSGSSSRNLQTGITSIRPTGHRIVRDSSRVTRVAS